MRNCRLLVTLAAYQFAIAEGLPIEEALSKAGDVGQVATYSRLGALLVDAKVISQQQLDSAQKTSFETGLPLGRMLCEADLITAEVLLPLCMNKGGSERWKISKEEAVHRIAQSQKKPLANAVPFTAKVPGSQVAPTPVKVKLGELLLVSGLLSEIDVMNALELSLTHHKAIGEILVESGMVTAAVIQAATEMQQSINEGSLPILGPQARISTM